MKRRSIQWARLLKGKMKRGSMQWTCMVKGEEKRRSIQWVQIMKEKMKEVNSMDLSSEEKIEEVLDFEEVGDNDDGVFFPLKTLRMEMITMVIPVPMPMKRINRILLFFVACSCAFKNIRESS